MGRRVLLSDRVFDSVEGRMLEDHAVVIEGDRVVEVVPSGGVEVTERLAGYTLLPGLIDVHTHLAIPLDNGQGFAGVVQRSGAQDALLGVKQAGETIRAGFTSVRDAGAWRAFTDVALREAIDAGWVSGPRMTCAGAFVGCPGGGADITGIAVDVDEVLPRELRFGIVSGVDEMRATVRQILRYGADFIKVLATGAVLTAGTRPGAAELTDDELRAAVETSAEAGTHVAAHAHGTEGIKRAVRAGVRSIEHGSLLDDEAIELMIEHGTYLVADLYDSEYILDNGPGLGYSDEVMEKTRMTAFAQREGFTKAVTAGVKIAFGSDAAVFPHGLQGRQFRHYVEYGLTPTASIQSATRWAAELIGKEAEIGALAPGRYADLIAVAGDPLQNVSLLEDVALVMKSGEWVVGLSVDR
jgi:imidazolonepropionase-like amidohydrolase